MKTYVRNFHKSILGLTGTEDLVKQAEDAYKVYAAKVPGTDASNYAVDHSAFLYLMSPDDQLLEIVSSEDSAGAFVAKIKSRLEEATQTALPTEAASGKGVSTALPEIDVENAMADRPMGRADAPKTIIEYASMTCSHCADFHNHTLPEVKKALIETGKARLIFRDMPWDTFALKASMMARCAPPEKYSGLVESIFKNQDRWSKSDDPLSGLIELGTSAGMEERFIEACMNSAELENAIVARVQEAQRTYNVKSTPTFIFTKGAERIEHFTEFEELLSNSHGQ